MALLLAAVTFVLMTFFHVRQVTQVLVAGPLAMAWYWPRRSQPGPPAGEPR
jgi:chromate transporter